MSDDLNYEKPAATRTILIVEDDEPTGQVLTLAFTLENLYRPVVVESSARAFEVVKTTTPDLFIIDYLLSDENGLDLYEQLCAMQGLETIPVLFLTATDQAHIDLITQRNLVALRKPFDIDVLLQAVEQLLERPQETAA